MTAVKLDPKPSLSANAALSSHASTLFACLGSTRIGVVELKSAERTDAAPDEEKEASVKLRVVSLEIANADQQEALRRCLSALHTHRTAYGTLTEEQDVELSKSVIEATGGELNAIEAARLHVVIDRWSDYAHRVLSNPKITLSGLRNELDTIVKGLRAGVDGADRLL